LTKVHEEFLRGRLSDILTELNGRQAIKGECTLLVAPEADSRSALPEEIQNAVLQELAQPQGSVSDIAKKLARRFGLKRTEAYQQVLSLQKLQQNDTER